jgi:hypothetical protein
MCVELRLRQRRVPTAQVFLFEAGWPGGLVCHSSQRRRWPRRTCGTERKVTRGPGSRATVTFSESDKTSQFFIDGKQFSHHQVDTTVRYSLR